MTQWEFVSTHVILTFLVKMNGIAQDPILHLLAHPRVRIEISGRRIHLSPESKDFMKSSKTLVIAQFEWNLGVTPLLTALLARVFHSCPGLGLTYEAIDGLLRRPCPSCCRHGYFSRDGT